MLPDRSMLEVELRREMIDGISDWHWIAVDHGAWDGPRTDWVSHKKWIEALVERKGTVVQAGGCMGMYPRLLSRMFEHVLTFEPDPENFRVLKMNCDSPKIEPLNAALGAYCGKTKLKGNSPTNTNRGTISLDDKIREGETGVVTLDSLLLGSLDYIMLDVEGYEEFVLKGAIETIKRFSPVISLERPNSEARDVLDSLGYVERASSVSDNFFTRSK